MAFIVSSTLPARHRLIRGVWPKQMKNAIITILTCFVCTVGCAAPATVGTRVTFTFDISQWESVRPHPPAGDVLKIQNSEGDFTVLVMPEKAISDGLSTPEARQKFIKGLSNVNAKAEDVKPVHVFEKDGHEFVGTRVVGGAQIRFRIILIVDAGDVLAIFASSVDEEPLKRRSIEAVWRSVKIH